MAKKKKEDSLAVVNADLGRSLTEFAKKAEGHGPELVTAALEKFKTDEQQKVIGKVNSLVNHIRSLYANRDKTDAEIKLFENRLQLINEGKFTIDSMGMIHFPDGFYC